jgi:arylsulfatase A-like enzyme
MERWNPKPKVMGSTPAASTTYSVKTILRCIAIWLALLWGASVVFCATNNSATTSKPNVIFILADDLGYGDLGCYGQKKIQTPNLDRMAAEGIRFTQCYAGTTVCAPSRCSLMTGKHTGHTTIRGNRKPEIPLTSEELTIPQVFKAAGYTTAMIGKWGVGGNDTTGAPNQKGFDFFLGYLTQTAAHDYYPPFIWRNTEKFPLPGNQDGKKETYTHDLFMQEALNFVRTNRDRPFFLYLPVTIPHANNENHPNGMQVPNDEPYSKENWPATEKNFAAMITRLDLGAGQLLALLKELKLDEKTLVVFTSDNGPHSEGGHRADFFDSSGELRGIKRDLYEGGIRVPMIARWPGKIKVGQESRQVVAFWDFLPTLAEFAGQSAPKGTDGISVLPALLENKTAPHPPLYWEFHEQGFFRAVRLDDWKGISLDPARPLELYDLGMDISEKHDLAAGHPEIVRQIEETMKREHVPHPVWPDPSAGANN